MLSKFFCLFLLFFSFSFNSFAEGNDSSKSFRFHVFSEPKNLNPRRNESSSGSYINQNLYRNLFWFDDSKGLVPDLAESCLWSKDKKTLNCKLKKNLKWSDGSPLDADSVLKNLFEIVSNKEANSLAIKSDLLKNLKDYDKISGGLIQDSKTWAGLKAKSKSEIQFNFSRLDPEFLYKLASNSLALYSENKFSGPYQIANWEKTKKIVLKTNPNYWKTNSRPNVEVFFVSDDSVALRMYQTDQIDFLRRLPTQYISEFKSSKEFVWLEVARLDYWAFGAGLRDNPLARQLLSESLDYQELQKIYQSEGTPGCTGLPKSWTDGDICLKQSTPKASDTKLVKWPDNLTYFYSTQGGEDHKRTAEWMQGQWKKSLGLNVQTKSLENKIYIQTIKENEPTIFRKGVAPDRPTCLAALESFVDPDIGGYQLRDPEVAALIHLAEAEASDKARTKLCHQILKKMILEKHLLVPTGPIHFAMLQNLRFVNWKLNSLNYLDLSELQAK